MERSVLCGGGRFRRCARLVCRSHGPCAGAEPERVVEPHGDRGDEQRSHDTRLRPEITAGKPARATPGECAPASGSPRPHRMMTSRASDRAHRVSTGPDTCSPDRLQGDDTVGGDDAVNARCHRHCSAPATRLERSTTYSMARVRVMARSPCAGPGGPGGRPPTSGVPDAVTGALR
jgi:hypothetical protein